MDTTLYTTLHASSAHPNVGLGLSIYAGLLMTTCHHHKILANRLMWSVRVCVKISEIYLIRITPKKVNNKLAMGLLLPLVFSVVAVVLAVF